MNISLWIAQREIAERMRDGSIHIFCRRSTRNVGVFVCARRTSATTGDAYAYFVRNRNSSVAYKGSYGRWAN
jgi:hypothetical protein